ncbi:MAG: AAA family ATPase, partial [bacterium]
MHRDIEEELYRWKKKSDRYPLIIRGARQVGKTYLIESFGKEAFSKVVTVNFEFQPQMKKCFKTLDPLEIINKLQLLLNVSIEGGDTLLFLDEIQ